MVLQDWLINPRSWKTYDDVGGRKVTSLLEPFYREMAGTTNKKLSIYLCHQYLLSIYLSIYLPIHLSNF